MSGQRSLRSGKPLPPIINSSKAKSKNSQGITSSITTASTTPTSSSKPAIVPSTKRDSVTKRPVTTTKRASIPPASTSVTVRSRLSITEAPHKTSPASALLVDKISTQESRISALEDANLKLTSEIKLIRDTSSQLKDDIERVQFVVAELVDLESRLEETNLCNNRLAAENSELKTELSQLKSEILILKNHPRVSLGSQEITHGDISTEQQVINSNIIIRGVDFDENVSHSDLLNSFNKIRSHLGVSDVCDFEPAEIGEIRAKHSKEKDTSNRIKTIQVKFRSVIHKRKFLQVRRAKKSILPSDIGIEQISNKPILIVEQLTKQNQELLYNARSLRTHANFKFVWSNNGQILARPRQGAKVIRIRDIDHINQLKVQIAPSQPENGFIHAESVAHADSSNTQA